MSDAYDPCERLPLTFGELVQWSAYAHKFVTQCGNPVPALFTDEPPYSLLGAYVESEYGDLRLCHLETIKRLLTTLTLRTRKARADIDAMSIAAVVDVLLGESVDEPAASPGGVSSSGRRKHGKTGSRFMFDEWGIGYEADKKTWHVFRITNRGQWEHQCGQMVLLRDGMELALMTLLLEKRGRVSRTEAEKCKRDKTGNAKNVPSQFSRLRVAICASFGADITKKPRPDPFQKVKKNSPHYDLRIAIGQAVRDDEQRQTDRPRLQFLPCNR